MLIKWNQLIAINSVDKIVQGSKYCPSYLVTGASTALNALNP